MWEEADHLFKENCHIVAHICRKFWHLRPDLCIYGNDAEVMDFVLFLNEQYPSIDLSLHTALLSAYFQRWYIEPITDFHLINLKFYHITRVLIACEYPMCCHQAKHSGFDALLEHLNAVNSHLFSCRIGEWRDGGGSSKVQDKYDRRGGFEDDEPPARIARFE